MSRGTPIISIRLPRETITALRKISKDTNVSVSDLIRQQIDAYIASQDIHVTPEQLPGQMSI